jgi:hypothetical protein
MEYSKKDRNSKATKREEWLPLFVERRLPRKVNAFDILDRDIVGFVAVGKTPRTAPDCDHNYARHNWVALPQNRYRHRADGRKINLEHVERRLEELDLLLLFN